MNKQAIILNSNELHEKSLGLRFALPQLGEFATGFVVRFHGKAHAYVNQCAHVPVELDWEQGHFFTMNKDYLICPHTARIISLTLDIVLWGRAKEKACKHCQ